MNVHTRVEKMLNIKLTILLALGGGFPKCPEGLIGDPISGPCMHPTTVLILSCLFAGLGLLALAGGIYQAARRRYARGLVSVAGFLLFCGGTGLLALYLHANLTPN